MAAQRPRDILLVRNGDSPLARQACDRARGIFHAGGYNAVFLDAPSATELSEALTDTVRSRAVHVAAVVAVGGDGMAHLVLQVLHEVGQQGVDVAFGLIPAGSGNDLARFCGIPTRDTERAAGRVLRGLETPSQHMDLLAVDCADGSSHVCATTVCLGLDARVNARANRWTQIRVPAKYAVALVWEIMRLTSRDYTIDYTRPDGARRVADRRATFLSVANTSSYGGGLTIVPRADHRDGRAELFAVSDARPLRLLFLLPRLLLKTHENLAEIALEPVTSVTVVPHGTSSGPTVAHGTVTRSTSDPETRTEKLPPHVAHGDGEPLGPLPVRVRILPAAVRVLF